MVISDLSSHKNNPKHAGALYTAIIFPLGVLMFGYTISTQTWFTVDLFISLIKRISIPPIVVHSRWASHKPGRALTACSRHLSWLCPSSLLACTFAWPVTAVDTRRPRQIGLQNPLNPRPPACGVSSSCRTSQRGAETVKAFDCTKPQWVHPSTNISTAILSTTPPFPPHLTHHLEV